MKVPIASRLSKIGSAAKVLVRLLGLKDSDEVRIAGVKVGQVQSVKLEGDRVRVTFKAKDAFIGSDSTAAIEIKTLLGQKYMSIQPRGSEPL